MLKSSGLGETSIGTDVYPKKLTAVVLALYYCI